MDKRELTCNIPATNIVNYDYKQYINLRIPGENGLVRKMEENNHFCKQDFL